MLGSKRTRLPDPDFGENGVFGLPNVGHEQFLSGLSTRAQGGLLAVGSGRWVDDFVVYALTAEGDLDKEFRGEGCFKDTFGEPSIVRLIHSLDDKKILVAGELTDGLAMARYEPGGDFDPTFNGGKAVKIDVDQLRYSAAGFAEKYLTMAAPGTSGIPSILMNFRCVADGSGIFYGFDARYGSAHERLIVIVRLTYDGHPDSAFGSGGHFILTLPGGHEPWCGFECLSIQQTPAGPKLLVLGVISTEGLGSKEGLLFRLNPNGTVDTSFGPEGSNTLGIVRVPRIVEFAWTISVLASGTICVGGQSASGAVIVGFTCDGLLDTRFNEGNPVLSSLPTNWVGDVWDQAWAAQRLTFAGMLSQGGDNFIVLRRFDATGKPDVAFGEEGLQQLRYTAYEYNISRFHILPLSTGQAYVGAGQEIYRLLE